MPDFRSLISRMADELDYYRQLLMDDRRETHALATEARTALAEPEPEGPTPAGLNDDDDLEAAAQHIYEAMRFERVETTPAWSEQGNSFAQDAAREAARAVLARWGRPVIEESSAVQPADGEVAELVALIRQIALAWEPEATLLGNMTAGQLARAADLLESLSPPQPVPVSERLPGDELCWWFEADEDCGYGSNWTLLRIRGSAIGYTHWLPAHALPLPGEVEG